MGVDEVILGERGERCIIESVQVSIWLSFRTGMRSVCVSQEWVRNTDGHTLLSFVTDIR